MRRPLSVAVFGQTGVGKSTLLNSIFGTDLETSDYEPCTGIPNIIEASNGDSVLRFIDLPGFGESSDTDDGRLELWKDQVNSADIIMIVIFATSRSIDLDFEQAKKVLHDSQHDNVIVVCNQTDRIVDVPDGWLFSLVGDRIKVVARKEMQELIDRKRSYIRNRANFQLSKKCSIVYCSALTGYGVLELCKEIHSRIPIEASFSFSELVDPNKIGVIPRTSSRLFVPRMYHEHGGKGLIFDSKSFE